MKMKNVGGGMDKKYSKKKRLSLHISNEEAWTQYNKKETRRYHNLSSDWKQKLMDMPVEQKKHLLFKYSLEGNKRLVKFLIENCDLSPNVFDLDRNSPIMFAVKSGSVETVEYLLKKWAEINYVDALGVSPLLLATSKNHLKMVEILLKYEANINIEDSYNQTPLFEAIKQNDVEIIDLLLAGGADIEHKNREGRTALMVSAFDKSRIDAMKKILSFGANVNATDNLGKTALMHAINNNNGAMMDILLKCGAEINTQDVLGNTPLMICAKRGNREGTRVLVAMGADVFSQNKNGQTAYDIARACGNTTCAEILAKAEKIYTQVASENKRKEKLEEFARQNKTDWSCRR